MNITPKAFILCDHIRREEGGKFLLSGVYTGGPVISQVPSYNELNIFCTFDVQSAEPFDLHFSITSESFTANGYAAYTGHEERQNVDLVLPFVALVETGEDIILRWRASENIHGEMRWTVRLAEHLDAITDIEAERERKIYQLKRDSLFAATNADQRDKDGEN